MRSSRDRASRADEVIGRTVWQLLAWGWTLRSRGRRPGVAEIVGIEAARILGRTDATKRRGLGDARIEQLFEQSMATATGGWRWKNRQLPMSTPWRTVSVSSLRAHRPRGVDLLQAARRLLANDGRWDEALPFQYGDDERTAGGQQEIDSKMPRFVSSLPAPKNGVET